MPTWKPAPHGDTVDLFEQLRLAEGRDPYKPETYGPSYFTCGGNPSLEARRAYNVRLGGDDQVATLL